MPAASPAVSKDLEGDWAGTIQTPGADFQVEVHFRNQPDKTVLATIDIPIQKAIGMPINDVREAGEKLEFGLKIAHAGFQGKLDHAKGQITGQLGHDQQSMPVVLRKK